MDYRITSVDSIVKDYVLVNSNMKKLYNNQKKLFKFVGNDFEEFISIEFNKLEQAFNKLNADSKTQCPKYKYGNPTDYFNVLREEHKDNLKIR